MKSAMKKECILSLSAMLGKLAGENLHTIEGPDIEREVVRDNAKDLYEIGLKALKKCAYAKADKNYLRRVKLKIDIACELGNGFDFILILSMLFNGLNDLTLFCKEKDLLEEVEGAALNLMTVWDPNLEFEDTHQVAKDKYNIWIEEENV